MISTLLGHSYAEELALGNTLPATDMLDRLKRQGQEIIIVADRKHLRGTFGTLLTCDAQGERGYVVVLSGSSRGNPAKAKIKHVLTDCSYYDIEAGDDPDPPSVALNAQAANANCERLVALKIGVDACGALPRYMELLRSDHGRIVFKAGLTGDPHAQAIFATARTAEGDDELVEMKAMTLAYVTRGGAAFSCAFHYEDWRYYLPVLESLRWERNTSLQQ